MGRWDSIRTIAKFDGNFVENAVLPVDQNNGTGDGAASSPSQRSIIDLTATKPTTSVSLLIEGLVQLLCLVLEGDQKISKESYQAICEQLHKINLIDESYATEEFEEIRSQYQMQIYKIICAVRGREIPISLPTGQTDDQTVETCWSRYRREFEEINFIAGGGFGKVFKARHKLDCIEYAVKQIKIHSTTIKLCHLAEVKTIASLNHPNVVQYKAAWLEPYLPDNRKKAMLESRNGLSQTETSSETTASSDTDRFFNRTNKETSDDDSSDFIQFVGSDNDLENNDNSCSEFENEAPARRSNNAVVKYESNNSLNRIRPRPELAILYIQMSLCQITLRKWMDDRNRSKSFDEFYIQLLGKQELEVTHIEIVNDLFCQILSGIDYIHSRGIVHHDIKPSNIFLGIEQDGKIIAQLGDFGLACPLQNGHRGIALGTPLYAAPEQLRGECNPKSDIYSLGIVLLELLLKFQTDMERVRTIENARKGALPSDLSGQSAHFLLNLLVDEAIRPSTKEVLEAARAVKLEQNLRAIRVTQVDVKLKDMQIKNLKHEIQELHNDATRNESQIQDLLDELTRKESEILNLKLELKLKDEQSANLQKQLNAFLNNLSIE